MKVIIKTETGKNYDGEMTINGNTATITDLKERHSGRKPTSRERVKAWKAKHPNGRPSECIKETGIPRSTVYLVWKDK